MSRPRHLVALLGLPLLAYGASPAFATATVHIDLLEKDDGGMVIAAPVDSVGAGKVTFQVANKSQDIEHEFLIARLTVAPENVPFDENDGIVKEDALKGVRELGDLEPGSSGTMTLDLKPGKYLMFCNLPGHYKAGMYHVLTVTG